MNHLLRKIFTYVANAATGEPPTVSRPTTESVTYSRSLMKYLNSLRFIHCLRIDNNSLSMKKKKPETFINPNINMQQISNNI